MFVNKGRGTFFTSEVSSCVQQRPDVWQQQGFCQQLELCSIFGALLHSQRGFATDWSDWILKRACHKQVTSFWLHHFWYKKGMFLSFQSELCAWRCIFWICWVMHSLHLYIFEWNFWVKVAETIFLPFIRRLGAPGDQQKSLQLQPQLSLQLDRCSLSSN